MVANCDHLSTHSTSPVAGGYDGVMKPFTYIAVGVFALVALLHVLRLLFGWEATIAGLAVPLWVSLLGTVIAGGLAVMVWRESRG